jgi:hypothetical protein
MFCLVFFLFDANLTIIIYDDEGSLEAKGGFYAPVI